MDVERHLAWVPMRQAERTKLGLDRNMIVREAWWVRLKSTYREGEAARIEVDLNFLSWIWRHLVDLRSKFFRVP